MTTPIRWTITDHQANTGGSGAPNWLVMTDGVSSVLSFDLASSLAQVPYTNKIPLTDSSGVLVGYVEFNGAGIPMTSVSMVGSVMFINIGTPPAAGISYPLRIDLGF